MKISGWGNRPKIYSVLHYPSNIYQVQDALASGQNLVARGLGRSYGDSSLSDSSLCTERMDHFIGCDPSEGILQCEAGVSLNDILNVCVPKGWFLPVTPGTKFVTIGGAIASDVHGKNHHVNGCFSEHVKWIDILLADGNIKRVSREIDLDLFRATCGGMGLTGIILTAEIQLMKVESSYINQTTIKTKNLKHTLEIFDQTKDATYSVAWIDCLASGNKQGRCLLTLGEHANDGEFHIHDEGKLSIPFNFPSIALNKLSVAAFNTLYYGKVWSKESSQRVHYDPYFYPLDGIHNWNRIYGKNGFIQYQFVVPYESGLYALEQALAAMSKSGLASFLAVLKHLGKANENYLSFPMEGYTLAVDFKWNKKLPDLIKVLDRIVRENQGRLYLTKDSSMDSVMFKETYHQVDKFIEVRNKYGAKNVFNSLQSKRLGL